jgi:uncharacterized repeat protein (TIGR03803 family)
MPGTLMPRLTPWVDKKHNCRQPRRIPTRAQTSCLPTRTLAVVIAHLFFYAGTAIGAPSWSFTTLLAFNGVNGAEPNMSLAQGFDGDLYGTTGGGGANCGSAGGCGTVFKVTSAGTLTTLYSFCAQTDCVDGNGPTGELALAANGDFYGTTVSGGAHSGGTVFKITPSGTLTTLYSFCAKHKNGHCADGDSPVGGLVRADDGTFYGVTSGGGVNCECGTVFKITPGGALTTLHSFDRTDGNYPTGGLALGTSGNLLGVTGDGGGGANCKSQDGCGTIFKITPRGTLTTLYNFCSLTDCPDGGKPQAGLVQAASGNFYGTTIIGGTNCAPAGGCGTVFKVTPTGTLTALYSFCAQNGQYNCSDGSSPYAALVQGTDGNFYGTTVEGGSSGNCGSNGCGTVFKITPSGRLTTLRSFDGTDGTKPFGGLLQATDGNFYGATSNGGDFSCPSDPSFGCGTIFRLSGGLGPFVSLLPYSGKVATVAYVLGTNLTGATNVTFNGTLAAFTFVSKTEVKTAVPSGATTGFVTITTPGGTLKSNIKFHVTP